MQVINEKDDDAAQVACELLKAGKIISFPTDTLYGLAVDASNSKAVSDLYKIKNRDHKKPITIFLRDLDAAKKIFSFDEKSKEIAEKYLPGALTLILKTRDDSLSLSPNLNEDSNNFLGFRIVDSFFVRNLFKKFDGILAVTSANISGDKPAKDSDEVKENFSNIDLIIKGKISKQQASTVAKITNNKIIILRQGAISL